MTSKHHQKPVDYCDAYLNLKLRLSLATCIDPIDYAKWLRDNAAEFVIGFDRHMRDNERDLRSDEHEIELFIYGRMQYSRSTGKEDV